MAGTAMLTDEHFWCRPGLSVRSALYAFMAPRARLRIDAHAYSGAQTVRVSALSPA